MHKHIKDVIGMTNGFFNHITYSFPSPITKESLDLQYYTKYSQKLTAPIINLLMEQDEVSQLTDAELDTIGTAILQTYKHKWDKYIDVYNLVYNPIYNYKDEYTETINKVKSDTDSTVWSEDTDGLRTDNLSESKSTQTQHSNTRTDNLQDSNTKNLSEVHSGSVSETGTRTDNLNEAVQTSMSSNNQGNAAHNVFGFNSSTAVGDNTDTSTGTETNTGSQTTANTGTQGTVKSTTDGRTIGHTGTDSTSHTGTQSNAGTGSETQTKLNTGSQSTSTTNQGIKSNVLDGTEDIERSYSHIGNIGNHPTQMLVEKELEIWRWNFVNTILEDVMHFTTLPIYD